LQQLIARVGWQKACVAMANKNVRILWAVMTRETGFDAKHGSVKPPGECKARPSAARCQALKVRHSAMNTLRRCAGAIDGIIHPRHGCLS